MNKTISTLLIGGSRIHGSWRARRTLATSNAYALSVIGKPGGVGDAGHLRGAGINGGANTDGHTSPRANGGSAMVVLAEMPTAETLALVKVDVAPIAKSK